MCYVAIEEVQGVRTPTTAHLATTARCGYWVTLSFGFVLSCGARLWIYLFGTAKGHNRPTAISEMGNCIVPLIVQCLWEGGVCAKAVVPPGDPFGRG